MLDGIYIAAVVLLAGLLSIALFKRRGHVGSPRKLAWSDRSTLFAGV
jgi:hypothetical protein